MAETYVLDTSLLLGGKEPPPGRACVTTPEAAAEVSPGGRDHRRFLMWQAAGLRIEEADPAALTRVEQVARAAGNLARLSAADLSLAALALGLGARGILVTDDHTLLDVARRLGVRTETINTAGIRDTLEFRPRCSGCGRWFTAPQLRNECPVCGSLVRDKPWKPTEGAGERRPAGSTDPAPGPAAEPPRWPVGEPHRGPVGNPPRDADPGEAAPARNRSPANTSTGATP